MFRQAEKCFEAMDEDTKDTDMYKDWLRLIGWSLFQKAQDSQIGFLLKQELIELGIIDSDESDESGKVESEQHYGLFLGDESSKREFTFRVEEKGKAGWVSLRCVKVFDTPTVVLPNPSYYDPSICLIGAYHSCLWRARWSRHNNTYVLYGAFGNPGNRITLDIL